MCHRQSPRTIPRDCNTSFGFIHRELRHPQTESSQLSHDENARHSYTQSGRVGVRPIHAPQTRPPSGSLVCVARSRRRCSRSTIWPCRNFRRSPHAKVAYARPLHTRIGIDNNYKHISQVNGLLYSLQGEYEMRKAHVTITQKAVGLG